MFKIFVVTKKSKETLFTYVYLLHDLNIFFLLMNFGLGDKKNGIELNVDTQINKNIIFIRSAILRPT